MEEDTELTSAKKSPPVSKKKRSGRQVLIGIAVIAFSVIGYWVWWPQPEPPTQEQAQQVTVDSGEPSESKDEAKAYKWNGGADEPKRLLIPTIGIDTYVQATGVTPEQQLEVPNNVHLSGWFRDGAKPGQNGLAIIAGHVTGRTSDGVFLKLKNLKAGDRFQVQRGDGTQLDYQVKEVKIVPEAESAELLFNQDPAEKSQLNLITCGGEFDDALGAYPDRVIVSARLVSANL